MAGVISASMPPSLEVQARLRIQKLNKSMSEYIAGLIEKDLRESKSRELDQGQTYEQAIEQARLRLAQLEADKAVEESKAVQVNALMEYFNAHDQIWRDTIVNRFMEGKAVFAKNYLDVMRVQRAFEGKYNSSEFFWHHSMTQEEQSGLIESALKEA